MADITRERLITLIIVSAYPQILDEDVPEKIADALLSELSPPVATEHEEAE